MEFKEKSFSEKFKTIAKTVCILLAVFSIIAFSGCSFFDSLLNNKDDNKDDGNVDVEDEVTVSPTSVQIHVGESVTLTAESSEGRGIIWLSDDDGIATVDDDGKVTGISAGIAYITADDGIKMANCEVEVLPSEQQKPDEGDDKKPEEGDDNKDDNKDDNQPKITLNSTAVTITEGTSFTLTARASDQSEISWSSSNNNIASVVRGRVTGVGKGTAIITASSVTAGTATCTVTVNPKSVIDYELVWSDEFEGNSLDETKWDYQVGVQDNYYGNMGPWLWGNEELQYYTDGANLKISDGTLQITAKRQDMDNGRTFSSSRITTRDKYSFTYGYIEAKMKTPAIEGMWPAFWMLPQPLNHNTTDNIYGGWPANGELDIMEAKGRLKNQVDTTLHYGGPNWEVHQMSGKTTPLLTSTEEWHTYGVEWTDKYIAWVVDGNEVYRVNSSVYWSSSSNVASAPFDQPFYILLNLAVGGMYDSYHEPPADFQQATMYVDYVRVYQSVK